MKLKNIILIGLIVPNILWADRFTKNGEIVYDSKTELYWQSQPSSKKFDWSGAIEHCSNLTYGGKSDWRLPNLYELKSLVDYKKYNPAIATTLIDIKTYDWYWSSSKDVSDSASSWLVNFKNGGGNWYNKSDKNYALCVR
jgi:hypothetical protein